jgi:hypothetical protein
MPFRFGTDQQARWDRVRGQADLLSRHGPCSLALPVDAPEAAPTEPVEYLGVDLGVITLAATADGAWLNHSTGPKHAHVHQVRARSRRALPPLSSAAPAAWHQECEAAP